MEEQTEAKAKVTSANLTWVEKYRPGALQELISHEGKINRAFKFSCWLIPLVPQDGESHNTCRFL